MKMFAVLPALIMSSSIAFAKITEIALPSSTQKKIEALYDETRGNADCCGVSTIKVFAVEGKLSNADLIEALEVTSKTDRALEVLVGEEKAKIKLKRKAEKVSLAKITFSGVSFFEGLEADFKTVVRSISRLIGTNEVNLVFSAEAAPGPNVDGLVEVGLTPNGKFLIVVVSDYGA